VKTKNFLIFIGMASLILIAYAGYASRFSFRNEAYDSGCPRNSDPVCGENGTTYRNACEAEAQGMPILYNGQCSVPSSLTQDERTFLMWLLREREAAGMQSVPVRHVITSVSPSLPDSTFYEYQWDGGSIEIEVSTDGEVVRAIDSAGVDYLADTNKQNDQKVE
jgi:hypothetical protein